jgi:hypothetical protein
MLIIRKKEFLGEIGVLSGDAFSLDRVNVESEFFFTSARGIRPQVLDTLLTENKGFAYSPDSNVQCVTHMLH